MTDEYIIYIFDDDENSNDTIQFRLEQTGKYKVEKFANKESIMKQYADEIPDIILVDVQVDDPSSKPGYAIIKELMNFRDIYRNCIIMTGQEKVDIQKIENEEKDFPWFRFPILQKGDQFAERLQLKLEEIELLMSNDELKRWETMRQQFLNAGNDINGNPLIDMSAHIYDDPSLYQWRENHEKGLSDFCEKNVTINSMFSQWRELIGEDNISIDTKNDIINALTEYKQRIILSRYEMDD